MKPFAVYYKILKYQQSNLSLLREYFDFHELENPLQRSLEVLSRANLIFAPLGFSFDEAYMDLCPALKVIVSNTTGIPHIDQFAAKRRGIKICALHDDRQFLRGITSTAEHTIGLMLAASRRLPAAHMAASNGEWDRKNWGAPRMMSRARLGLVGYGRLGRRVGQIARAMGMDVIWFDPYVTQSQGGVTDILDLARNSNILSIHAVANDSTRGLVSRRVLEQLPEGAIVINTARGEILDTEALIDLLESGHLWGAALDTLDGEYELSFTKWFGSSRVCTYARSNLNLILTPHIAGSTVDAWELTERRVISKACKILRVPFPHSAS